MIALTVLCLLATNYSFGQSKIAVFYDQNYTETCTNFDCEAYNTYQTILEQGNAVTIFSGLNSNSFYNAIRCKKILAIPETENGDFATDIDSATIEVIKDYVSAGGGLVLFGSDGVQSFSSSSVENLNSIFDLGLVEGGFASFGSTFLNNTGASGTTFDNGVDTIPNLITTNLIDNNSLPADAKIIYDDGTNASIVMFPYGDGKIIYVGWSWFQGGPGDSQDGSIWESLLSKAITEIDQDVYYPDCLTCDTEPPVAYSPSFLPLGIAQSGVAIIDPGVIDNGSFDNCGLDTSYVIVPGLTSNIVDCSQVGDTVVAGLVVVDEASLSDTSWTTLEIVDLLPPLISCQQSLTLDCTESVMPALDDTLQLSNSNMNAVGPTTGTSASSTITVSGYPAGATIADINVTVEISHINLSEVTVSLISPNGISIPLFDQECNGSSLLNVTYDDEAGPFNCGTTGIINGVMQSSQTSLSALDLEHPVGMTGVWILNVSDNVDNNFGGQLSYFAIDFIIKLPQSEPYVDDNCQLDSIWHQDINSLNNCGTGSIDRTWFARDVYNNINTCTQTITVVSNISPVIVFPPDYSVDCGAAPNNLDPTSLPATYAVPVPDNPNYCGQLIFNHSDQLVGGCSPVGDRIERTWTVTDNCNATFNISATQIVEVVDNTAPQITCGNDTIITMPSGPCLMTIPLNMPMATDNCDPNPQFMGFEIRNAGGALFANPVPAGIYTVTTTFQDLCGNANSCSYSVNVLDIIPPSAQSLTTFTINIGLNGSAALCATEIDFGSTDNCTIDNLLASRDGINFSPCVSFSCADTIPLFHSVTLRVFDGNGNFDDDVTQVSVIDTITPQIVCPANVTVDCNSQYPYLGESGSATANSGCKNVTIDYTDIGYSLCNLTGQFQRNWTLSINNSVVDACSQIISFSSSGAPVIDNPEDITISCSNPNTAPNITGFLFYEQNCNNYDVTYDDQIFDICAPGKFVIKRTWEAFNTCTFTTDYTYLQEIRVDDAEPPLFSDFPVNYTVFIDTADCMADLNLPILELEDNCDGEPVLTYTITDQNGLPFLDPTQVPAGIYTIRYETFDACGNFNSENLIVSAIDETPPQAICKDTITVSMNASLIVSITPQMLNNGSWDHCTSNNDLLFKMESNSVPFDFINFGCEDIGFNEVRLLVYDRGGLVSSCNTIVRIIDPANYCTPVSDVVRVSGCVKTEIGTFIKDFDVTLDGPGLTTVLDGNDNTYLFPQVPTGSPYTVTCEKLNDITNGVSTFDILLIRKHLLNLEYLDSPYKIIAADANGNEAVTTFDILVIRKVILSLEDQFADNKPWRFIEAEHIFPDPLDPFKQPFPEEITINNLMQHQTNFDFTAVKTGDVNNGVSFSITEDGVDDRSSLDQFEFQIENQFCRAGESYDVVINSNSLNKFVAFQGTFLIDQALASDIEIVNPKAGMSLDSHFGLRHMDEGLLTMLWDNAEANEFEKEQELFTIRFTALQDFNVSELLAIQQMPTPSKAYNEAGRSFPINFEVTGQTSEFNVSAAFPNPFTNQTTIEIHSQLEQELTIQVFDASSKLVYSHNDVFPFGKSRINFTKEDLPSAGVYHVKISSATSHLVQKLIKLQ